MKKYVLYCLSSFFSLSVLFSPHWLMAAPYYQGKRINIIVGFATGSGYDRMTRMIARYLPKYIPGKPTIIIENMPGGSSIIAANHVFNISKPDGLTIGSVNPGLMIAQLMKVEEMKFDLRKFAWVGSTASNPIVFCMRTELPYKTFDQVRREKKGIFMSSGGPMTANAQWTNLLIEFLKLNVKNITYANSADQVLAVERKEVDGTTGTYASLRPMIERGVMQPLLRGRISEPEIEKLPIDEDLATDKIGKKLMAMRSATDKVGKPYVAPPGTSREVMAILRNAFAKVAKDPQMQSDAQKNMQPVEYLSAEESLKSIDDLLNQPENIVTEFKKYIKY